MLNSRSDYASYLLRLRCVSTGGRRTWTASLHSTSTGEERAFPSLDALAQFLKEQLTEEEQAQSPSTQPLAQ